MKTQSEKFRRQRKFLMVLPLLVLPFITLAFWALGGGEGDGAVQQNRQQTGYNATLPDARIGDGNLDKMSLYNQALQDSLVRRQARSLDPNSDSLPAEPGITSAENAMTGESGGNHRLADKYAAGGNYAWENNPDPNEAKVTAKLEALENALKGSSRDTPGSSADPGQPKAYDDLSTDADIDRLQQMMQNINASNRSGKDPEMQQLNGMLEKILDIQHPQRVQEQLQEASERGQGKVFAVTLSDENHAASLFPKQEPSFLRDSSLQTARVFPSANAFYDLDAGKPSSSKKDEATRVVIHETQSVVSGGTIKMRLLQAIYVNGTLIPKGNFIYGVCTLQGERLRIEVKGIRYGNSLFPVSLSVYDMDGMEGIHVPGAITRDAAKEGAGQAVQRLQLMGMDPSFTGQTAGAAVEAIKGLLSKKAKIIRVTVKAGYPVLLVDQKSRQQ